MPHDHPLLVTGAHRSGTTWIGTVLCATGEASYIDEPFNPGLSPSWAPGHFQRWFEYVCEENEGTHLELMRRILELRYPWQAQLGLVRQPRRFYRLMAETATSVRARRHGSRPLLKDPIAVFSAEWLARRFGVQPIMSVRHPAAFAGSIKSKGWTFDFRHWLQQPLLMDRLPDGQRAAVRRAAEEPGDIIEQSVLLWNVIYGVVLACREQYPGWIVVRHEDLARDPVKRFEELYQRAGLQWTEEARSVVDSLSSAAEPTFSRGPAGSSLSRESAKTVEAWRGRLTSDEVERVQAGTERVSAAFYQDADWGTD